MEALLSAPSGKGVQGAAGTSIMRAERRNGGIRTTLYGDGRPTPE
jgi:hypothetical protein